MGAMRRYPLREMWFAPGKDIKVLATFWRDNVLAGREGGRQIRRYTELRYERLILEPGMCLSRTNNVCGNNGRQQCRWMLAGLESGAWK